MNVLFRPLRMRDLGAIEQIEKRAYPTPWSRSMFASELSKASSICLGAFDEETDALLGYLIIARGIRRGYYTDNREDALIMWKDPVREPASA